MTMIFDGTNGITMPSGAVSNTTSTVVGISDAQTLTNKSIVASQLTGTQTIPKSTLPTGSVLQVVQGVGTGVTAANGTYPNSSTRATVASVSITPTSSSSKIYVSYSGQWYPYDSSPSTNGQVGMSGGLYRGSTAIQGPIHWQLQVNSASTYTFYGSQAYCVLDSPSTTSSTTYSMQVFGWSGNLSTVQLRETAGYIIVMEVAG